MTAASLITTCEAQIILNKPIDIIVGPLNFNPTEIVQNKVKSISVSISVKPDGEIIKSSGETLIYRFNSIGHLRRYSYRVTRPTITRKRVSSKPPKNESLLSNNIDIFVFYGIKNHIITKRIMQGELFHSYNYEYNRQGDIRKKYHCKETNISTDSSRFRLGEQTILTYKIYEYLKLTTLQTKMNYLNDELNIYKTAIINYDSTNNKTSETSEFIVSSKRNENYYTYDSLNRLVKHVHISNDYGEIKKESIYTYDMKGNILSESKTINGILCNDIQYMYDATNTFLRTLINRDHINATVLIKKYKYQHY